MSARGRSPPPRVRVTFSVMHLPLQMGNLVEDAVAFFNPNKTSSRAAGGSVRVFNLYRYVCVYTQNTHTGPCRLRGACDVLPLALLLVSAGRTGVAAVHTAHYGILRLRHRCVRAGRKGQSCTGVCVCVRACVRACVGSYVRASKRVSVHECMHVLQYTVWGV